VLADDLRIHTLPEHQRRADVPQVVKACHRQTGLLDHLLEVALAEITGMQRPAVYLAEDQPPVLVGLA